MNRFMTRSLGELCDVSIGRTPRRNQSRYWGGPHPWATIRDLNDRTLMETEQGITDAALDEVMPKAVKPKTLLFSFKLSIGKMAFAGQTMHHNEAIAALPIRDPNVLDREFLFHALKARTHAIDANHAVLGKVLNKRKVEDIQIPFPSLDEQRRIVGILNRAAKIERLRAQAANRLREFIPALFIKMFGDPVENPMGWEVQPLAVLVREFRYGTSRKCYDSAGGADDVPVLRIPNILRGQVDWTDLKFASLRGNELAKLNLELGDILFVRTNGNPDYIGRCATFRDRRQVAYASYLIRARLKPDGVAEPEYISNGLALPTMRQTLLQMTRTTAGNYNISIESLGRIRIPVPDMRLQRRFSAIVARMRETLNTTESSTQTSLDLSASLMNQLLEEVA